MSNRQGSRTRIPCTEQGCTATFSRKKDLERHEDEKHGEMKFCPHCNYRGAKRASRLKAHMETHHPELYNVPIIVPEQTVTERFGYIDQPQAPPSMVTPDVGSYINPSANAPVSPSISSGTSDSMYASSIDAPHQNICQSPQNYQYPANPTWPPVYYPESEYNTTWSPDQAGFRGDDARDNDLNQGPGNDFHHYTFQQL